MASPPRPAASPASRRSTRARLRFGLAWWAVLLAAWLLLVETVALPELLVGAAAAALAASVAETVRELGYVRFAPRLGWLRHAPRVGAQVLVDCGILFAALARRLVQGRDVHGVMLRIPVRYGGDGARDAARRALLNFGVSITPNSYVVDLDGETSTVLIHQLVAGPVDPLVEGADDAPAHDRGGDR
jgi:multisubunit Na+/H+ antiporter MnhE subunit